MGLDFSSLKKNSATNFDKLRADAAKLSAKSTFKADERFWQPTVDKSGIGFAIIRFLPKANDEATPFVRLWNHAFKGPGGWYIENCRTSINGPDGSPEADPVVEYNSKLWDAEKNIEGGPLKKQATIQKRKLSYIANILVIKDSAHPENEGKNFLYKFGQKIWDKLQEVMNPKFESETPMDPFDFWAGANFKIKIDMIKAPDGKSFRSYDKSGFDSPKPLLDDDTKLEEIWKSEYKLQPFVAPDQFKSYDVLKARLAKVLGSVDVLKATPVSTPQDESAENPNFGPREDEPAGEQTAENQEGLKFFQNLVDKN